MSLSSVFLETLLPRFSLHWSCLLSLWNEVGYVTIGRHQRSPRKEHGVTDRAAQFWASGEKAETLAFPPLPPLAVGGVRPKGQTLLLPPLSPKPTTDEPALAEPEISLKIFVNTAIKMKPFCYP